VVAALKGKSAPKVIGWDLTKTVIGGIDDGLCAAIVQQDPKQEGIEAVNELKSLINGGSPKGFIDVPITIVTKSNVDKFRPIFP
jgi:ribose transport system substrate-binding protein